MSKPARLHDFFIEPETCQWVLSRRTKVDDIWNPRYLNAMEWSKLLCLRKFSQPRSSRLALPHRQWRNRRAPITSATARSPAVNR
ncbi:hypothetical protein MESS4_560009 [Mesorhizobium sp. STM 4661]|nr:hypothetical protein MESS4_560009 [Mesorhizobium sp. STM 4661]